jgi:hypothetical protein
MAGVIGATSGKFVLIGAALLLHGRIDGNDARLAIMPGTPTSAITPELADRVKARSKKLDVSIHIRSESFRAEITGIEAKPALDAQVRLGQDVLASNPIEFDFAHREALPLSSSEARHLERRSRPITIHHEIDGSLSVELEQNGQAPERARLDLSLPIGVSVLRPSSLPTIKIGKIDLPKVDVSQGSESVVGLYAFKQVRVIFDLGNDRIWVRP